MKNPSHQKATEFEVSKDDTESVLHTANFYFRNTFCLYFQLFCWIRLFQWSESGRNCRPKMIYSIYDCYLFDSNWVEQMVRSTTEIWSLRLVSRILPTYMINRINGSFSQFRRKIGMTNVSWIRKLTSLVYKIINLVVIFNHRP